jgi:sulfur-oxidizing protein SoxA
MNTPSTLKLICLIFSFIAVVTINANYALAKTKNDFSAVYKEAETLAQKATSLGNQWRDTKKFLDQSKIAADNGQYDKAVDLANKAKTQYEMAIKQVQENEDYLKTVPFYDPNATPAQDIKNIQAFFREKFPKLPDTEFANGFYAMDPIMRVNWEAIEEFPPYMPTVDQGEMLWKSTFKNGKSYQNCFTGADVATNYPRWDRDKGGVETLPMAVNKCRAANGEKPLPYGKQDMLALQAYMAYRSRGNPTHVVVPDDDPRALQAYQQGKKFYFSRRGQLNMACYHCHFDNAGKNIRANVLSPALGQTTHWPAYRSKWGDMGSLHRRYKGCNKQVRAKPFDFQSTEYRNLEYFHTSLSNGIPANGPGSRF